MIKPGRALEGAVLSTDLPRTSPGACSLGKRERVVPGVMKWGWWGEALGPRWAFSSVAQSCPTLCDPMDCSTPGLPVHHQLPESTQTMSIELVMPSNHLILCRPLLLPPPIFPSIRVFSNESALRIRWPKYWSFSFSISLSNQHSGLISFRRPVGSTCSPRDSQEFFPTPQFKSINSLALSFLYSPTLTSIYDYWKNHSLD